MKRLKAIKLLSIKAIVLLCISVFTQNVRPQSVPYGFNYQAALRDVKGGPIADSTLNLTVWIRQGNPIGEIIYSEDHVVTTNTIGLFNVIIGNGDTDQDLGTIPWDKGPYFLELLMNNQSFSVTQLLSVPYAMHAGTASRLSELGEPIAKNDPTTKAYVDSILKGATTNLSTQAFVDSVIQDATSNLATQTFVNEELEKLNQVEFSSNGDTLYANGTQLVIPGLNANNNPALSSQVCLGGSENEQVKAFIKQDKGTYLMAAESFSRNGDLKSNNGQCDMWIAELDSTFNILWQTSIGGSDYDHVTHLIPLDNGEIILGGTTASNSGDISGNHGLYDIFIAFLDAEHTIRWSKTYGGSNADFLNDLHRMEDGSLIIGGTTFSNDGDIDVNHGDADIWLIKLDPHQETEWSKTYGGLRFEALEQITVLDDGILLFGETESNSGMVKGNNGGMDLWTAKIDMQGNLLSQQCIGSSNNEELHLVIPTETKFILGAISFSANWDPANSVAQKNIWISSIDKDMENRSSQTYGGNGSENIVQVFIKEDALIIAGTSSSYDGDITKNFGDDDFLLLQTNNDLSLVSQQNFGGSYSDQLILARQIAGGFLLAGVSESDDNDVSDNNGETDLWMIKTDSDFNIIATWHYGGSQMESIFDVIINTDLSFTLIGTTASNDFGISGFHGKAGKNRDILILKDTFK